MTEERPDQTAGFKRGFGDEIAHFVAEGRVHFCEDVLNGFRANINGVVFDEIFNFGDVQCCCPGLVDT